MCRQSGVEGVNRAQRQDRAKGQRCISGVERWCVSYAVWRVTGYLEGRVRKGPAGGKRGSWRSRDDVCFFKGSGAACRCGVVRCGVRARAREGKGRVQGWESGTGYGKLSGGRKGGLERSEVVPGVETRRKLL